MQLARTLVARAGVSSATEEQVTLEVEVEVELEETRLLSKGLWKWWLGVAHLKADSERKYLVQANHSAVAIHQPGN